jgi:hypothetical protein
VSWPLFLLGVAGIAIAIARPPLRRISFWLLTAVPAYYFGLINVVLYNYDRFVLPICFLLALFGGLALDSLLASERAEPWRRVAIAAVFAYSLLYAATVDVLMIRDSRYTVERWMARHIGPNDVVGVTGLHEYIPRVEGYRWVDVITIDDLLRQRPKYFVFNADYARAVPPETAWGQLGIGLQNGTLGYRLVLRYRAESILSWLPGAHPDLVGERRETLVFSVLRNINPTIEVFERVQ